MIYLNKDFNIYWPKSDLLCNRVFNSLMMKVDSVKSVSNFCENKRCCIQAGGHVGIWPIALSKYFDQVITFEPSRSCYRAMIKNISANNKIECYPFAIGEKEANLHLKIDDNSSRSKIAEDGEEVQCITIDLLHREYCDLIYLDVEGYEILALKGAIETIDRCHPVICVEELKSYVIELRNYIESIGYKYMSKFYSDSVWVYK